MSKELLVALACATGLACLHRVVAAQELEECAAKKDGTDRLKCFDDLAARDAKKKQDERGKAIAAEPDRGIRWQVRDTGTISAAGLADLGSKPGLFQLGRESGESFSTVKFAVIGVGEAIKQPGGFFDTWEPFFALAWERDTAAKTPKDQRQLIGGISGNVFNIGGGGTAVIATARIGHRVEIKKDRRDNFFNLHADVVHLPWVADDQTDATSSFIPIPYVGVLRERTTMSTAAEDGSRAGVYAGIKSQIQLYALLPRLSGTASIQWFRDWDAPAGVAKRSERFFDAGLTYHLVDPKAKKGWLPSISLTRQVGIEPVTGQGPSHKTVLGLGIKFF